MNNYLTAPNLREKGGSSLLLHVKDIREGYRDNKKGHFNPEKEKKKEADERFLVHLDDMKAK